MPKTTDARKRTNVIHIVKEIEKPLLTPQESFFIGSKKYKKAKKGYKKAKIKAMEKEILKK